MPTCFQILLEEQLPADAVSKLEQCFFGIKVDCTLVSGRPLAVFKPVRHKPRCALVAKSVDLYLKLKA